MADRYDLAVIGAGPGGYVAAIRAAQLGMKVVTIDKRQALGGTCLNIGCIPSKALLDSSELYALAGSRFSRHGILVGNLGLDLKEMMKRKDQVVKALTDGVAYLFKKNRITPVHGAARLSGPGKVAVKRGDGGADMLEAKAVLLATGSESATLPALPFDGTTIVSSTEALAFEKVPTHLIVVGGGYIGLELGSVWARLGAKVTVLEFLPRIVPLSDAEGLAGKAGHVNYDAIPSVIYTWPEVASVGLTEEQVKEGGRPYRVGKFPFAANGRARCLGETEGVVKILADEQTDRVLGVHIF